MIEELKPCPFCGDKAKICDAFCIEKPLVYLFARAQCTRCGVKTKWYKTSYNYEEDNDDDDDDARNHVKELATTHGTVGKEKRNDRGN